MVYEVNIGLRKLRERFRYKFWDTEQKAIKQYWCLNYQ